MDQGEQERIIRDSSLNRTIVRLGQLTNGKKRGTYKSRLKVGNYILTKMISRADVAHFLLAQLNDVTNIHKSPGIVY